MTFRFDLVTLFPEMFRALDFSIVKRAQTKNIIELHFWNPRDYTQSPHSRVDDKPYGGGPGMVMQFQPLKDTLEAVKKACVLKPHIIYLSPQGKLLTQAHILNLSQKKHLILIAGRYEGIDQRLIDTEVDEECSIGDYVLSGGELPAMVLVDSVTRLLKGALGDPESASQDSFMNGLLDFPHYTHPSIIDGKKVPEVLLSGNHQGIQRWRMKESLGQTWLKRKDLLEKIQLTKEQTDLLNEFIKEYHLRITHKDLMISNHIDA